MADAKTTVTEAIANRIGELQTELDALLQAQRALSGINGSTAPRGNGRAAAKPKGKGGRERRTGEMMAELGRQLVTYVGKQKEPIGVAEVQKHFPAVRNGMDLQYLLEKHGGAKVKKHGDKRSMTYSIA